MFSILKLKFHPSISFCLSGAKSLRQQSKQRTLDLCPHPSLPAYPRKHRGVPSWEASTQWHMPGTPHLTRRDPGQKLKPTELVPFEKGEIKTEITYWIHNHLLLFSSDLPQWYSTWLREAFKFCYNVSWHQPTVKQFKKPLDGFHLKSHVALKTGLLAGSVIH